MYLPEDKERGIFLQQDDFLDKDIRPVSEIEDQRPINQHWSWDKILRSPIYQASRCFTRYLLLEPPLEVYNKPVNMFVAGFIGSPTNEFLQCSLQGRSNF